MKACHLIAFITACCLSLPASARQAEIDRERMQQDLDIMEAILQNLHTQNTPAIIGSHKKPQIRGLYFENYGVIFLIEERRPGGIGFTLESFQWAAKTSGKHEEGDVVKGIRAQREKRRVAFQNRLEEFLGTYADAIHQLKDEDRITVLVHYQPVSPIPFIAKAKELQAIAKTRELQLQAAAKAKELQAIAQQLNPRDSLKSPPKGRMVPKQHVSVRVRGDATDAADPTRAEIQRRKDTWTRLRILKDNYAVLSEQVYSEVTAKKRDIVAYRRERINEAEFRKRIVSREHKPDASTMKKIGVLAIILDKALKRPDHLVPRFDKTLGIYQEGLGALFFVNAGSKYRMDHPVFKNKTKALMSPIHRRTQGKADTEESQILDRFKEDLINVVGDYGYSLRTLKPQEYIVVEVRFPEALWSGWSAPRGLVLKVRKKDVDAYIREDLDLAAFRQKVDIQEY